MNGEKDAPQTGPAPDAPEAKPITEADIREAFAKVAELEARVARLARHVFGTAE